MNCKFDQNTFESRKSCSTQSHDPLGLHTENSNLENYDIKEAELLFVDNACRDYGVRVLSSLNGVDYPTDGIDIAQMKQNLLTKYRFIGTAQTEHVANDRNAINQGLAATVSGVVTIQNNSTSTIHPGELLKVDYDMDKKKSIRGMPRNKKTFCLVPYQKKKDIDNMFKDPKINDIIITSIAEYNDSFDGDDNEDIIVQQDGIIDRFKTKIKDFLSNHSNSEQVVAKAMSYSRPGERLDILLHPRQY